MPSDLPTLDDEAPDLVPTPGDAAGELVRALRAAATQRLPPGLRSGRLNPGRRGALALVGLAVAAATVTAVVALRARPAVVRVAAPVHAPAPAAAKAAPSILVDVTGAVRRPGLVRLPAGARVADAVRLAGGVLPGTPTDLLNLARRVVDGELIVVGGSAPAVSGATSGAGPVNLNVATVDQLDGLPGVGPVLAQRIVSWREAHGGFASVDQLGEVGGIGPRKLADLRPLVTV